MLRSVPRLSFLSLSAALMLTLTAMPACTNKAKRDDPAPLTNNEKPEDLFKVTPDGALTRGETTTNLLFWATGPVAKVDGEEISPGRFNKEAYKLHKLTEGRIPPEYRETYATKITEQLVDGVLLERAVEAEGIEVPKEEVDEELADLQENQPRVFQMLTGEGKMTTEELRDELRAQRSYRLLLGKRYETQASDEEVARYYDENADAYAKPAEVSARHILFKVEQSAPAAEIEGARQKAAEVVLLARQPDADFAQLAQDRSEGPSAPRGGDLGYFPAERMVKPFSDAAFAMEVGEISEPVQTQFGWHVIKVEGKKPARTVPFEEVREQIKGHLDAGKVRVAYETFLTEAKAGAKIEIFPENIKLRTNEDEAAPAP